MDAFTDFWIFIILAAAGLIAGFIDSIVGGGGLISVPLLSILVGPGALAIGTNKVAAVCATGFALFIYMRGGHVAFRGNLIFALLTGVGAGFGALFAPMIPPSLYKWILLLIGPATLWVVFRKDIWVRHEIEQAPGNPTSPPLTLLWSAGFACGFYDGIAGPGGGTLMFLSLFLVAKIPLLAAMATAKLANLASASVSLATFAATGHVLWGKGAWLAVGISLGAIVGALIVTRHPTRHAAPLARAALAILAVILLGRLALT
jgi:uncharacterized protein